MRTDASGTREFVVDPKVAAAFRMAPSCCKSPSEFHYQPLAANGTIRATIDSKSAAFDFVTGKSFFLAYRLPPRTAATTSIEVMSWFDGSVFFPRLMLLDSTFSPTRTIGPPLVHYVRPSFFVRGHIEGRCTLLPGDPARYLVIMTTTSDLRRRLDSNGEPTVYTGPGAAVFLPGGTYANDFGPTGELTIKVVTTK